MTVEDEQLQLRRQLEDRGITDARVLDAIQRTRRDLFVPADMRQYAYADDALPIGHAQTISQPYIVALMTEAARLTGAETVLEVGTGSGYQAAVLSRLCRRVVTIERIAELAAPARRVLEERGYANVTFEVGDGTRGCPAHAPYDAILVTAAAPDVPQPLYDQLVDGGRLIIPVGNADYQELQRITKTKSGRQVDKLCDCRFVKLIGEAGWPGPQVGS